MLRFFCINHQGKANPYIEALVQRGFMQSENLRDADFCLYDHDLMSRAGWVESAMHRPVFLYPHTARPFVQYDGMYRYHPNVRAMFTVSKGHIYVYSQIGIRRPVFATGWALCPIAPFKSVKNPRRILFAPIHPNGNGYLSNRERQTNAAAYRKLLRGVKEGKIDLTVRHLHDIRWNGLWHSPRVRFVAGQADQSYKEIDEADVVVSHQTMAYIAVARGKPTLMMNEHHAPMSGNSPNNIKIVSNWDLYKDRMMYPLDLLRRKPLMALIEEAAGSDEKISDWRDDFIGAPFDGVMFANLLERML